MFITENLLRIASTFIFALNKMAFVPFIISSMGKLDVMMNNLGDMRAVPPLNSILNGYLSAHYNNFPIFKFNSKSSYRITSASNMVGNHFEESLIIASGKSYLTICDFPTPGGPYNHTPLVVVVHLGLKYVAFSN